MADTKLTGLTETSVPALDDWLYSVDLSDTTDDAAGSSRKLSFNRLLGMLNHVVQGRLTLESGVPVSTSDQTAKTNVYFTPYNGNLISLYDGTRWRLYSFSELTLALGTLTSGKNYDIFCYDNAGTLTLELSAAWTTDTARADALALQDGVYVKSGATTRRWIGTIRTTSTTTTEDSAANRLVWNAQNRVHRRVQIIETTATWTYTTDTYRQANAAAGNQISVVSGLAASLLDLRLTARAANSSTNQLFTNAIGEDATSGPATENIPSRTQNNVANGIAVHASLLAKVAPLGYHYYPWLERSSASGSTTWYGSSGGSPEIYRCGISGSYEC